jgi:SAM-dependent methyltransferase
MGPNPVAEAFYIEEARRRGGNVLALACGTGRYAVPMARSGLQVSGVDLSPSMLERARAKAESESVHLELSQLDMRNFCLVDRRFDLVTIAGNALLHLHKTDEIVECFRTIARHLTTGGALAFDVFVPSCRLLARDRGQRYLVGTFRQISLGEITVEETVDYDASMQVNRGTWYWSLADRTDFVVVPLHLRQIFPQELALMVEMAGFRLQQRYGDYDQRTFDYESRRQVCICEVV